MPAHLTGSPKWNEKRQAWIARITLPNSKNRPPVVLTEADGSPVPKNDEPRAKALAKLLSERARLGGAVVAGSPETVNEYAKRWLTSRVGRIASVRDNKGHLNEHILPVLGTLIMRHVTAAEIEGLVGALDKKVRDAEIGDKTAKNIWGTCTKMFDDATHAKPATGLRCLDSDPTDGVRGPDDADVDKLLQYLYPSEFLAFVSCPEVPLAWRRNAAVAVYLCLRDGEQRALKWTAMDLEHGVATIVETFDRRAGADREGTKSGTARQVPIHPELLPLLEVMHAERDGVGLVCQLPSLRDMARGLRRWLKRADVDRPQLHVTTSVSKQIRWHDLRASGLTWLAVEGRSPTEIRDIAGHTQTSMTDRYMRAAGVLRGGRFGEPFPPLPPSLFRRAGEVVSSGSDQIRSTNKAAFLTTYSGADGTRTRGLRRDRPAL
jgi:Phage integrase family